MQQQTKPNISLLFLKERKTEKMNKYKHIR